MKNQIHTIIIERHIYASRNLRHMSRDTMVSVHRGNTCKNYHTDNVFSGAHGISNASVIRAKRAQIALLEIGKADNDYHP